jgi:catechol 2,3-dioxygenase-like lactoylglutathione lyase family enzyme
MFSHVMIGANNVDESKSFYDAVLGAIGHKKGVMDPKGRCFYFADGSIFMLTKPIDGEPATHGNGSTLGFAVDSPEAADAWHAAGMANGGITCEDPPGVREGSPMSVYLAYLRDPSGNKICALYRMPQ